MVGTECQTVGMLAERAEQFGIHFRSSRNHEGKRQGREFSLQSPYMFFYTLENTIDPDFHNLDSLARFLRDTLSAEIYIQKPKTSLSDTRDIFNVGDITCSVFYENPDKSIVDSVYLEQTRTR